MKRPYVIQNKVDGTYMIVNATSKAQALRAVAEITFDAHPGSGTEIMSLMKANVPVMESGENVGDQPVLPGVEE
jgi:hypothetical protein